MNYEEKYNAVLERASKLRVQLEKQGECSWKPTEEQLEALDYAYNSCSDTERGNYYEGILETLIEDLHRLEKQGEQKSVNKAEPKFKVGQWIVNNITNDVLLIIGINNGYYTFKDIEGNLISPCLPPHESDWHIWTITDAKDGDVLASELTGSIFLFRDIKGNKIDFYCDYDTKLEWPDDRFSINDSNQDYGSVEKSQDIHPATKEQRELLFHKMKEEGYEWDAENKCLTKK